jgi:hypothetical protein
MFCHVSFFVSMLSAETVPLLPAVGWEDVVMSLRW